jgi:FAD/FMN-containing dehydrogenase
MAIAVLDNRQAYEIKRAAIAQQIKSQREASSAHITLKKETSNLFRDRSRKNNTLDVRDFNRVINVNVDQLIAEVEGMTTYEDLVRETLKHGCMPTVVPELKTITIGGALAGVGIESSSFRYGLVHETILQFDALLPDGRVVDCRPNNEHAYLFYAFPNSYGTLGYALKVTVRLIRVQPYVKLAFNHFKDPHLFFSSLQDLCLENRINGSIAFIDGVIFNANHQVLITGEMVNEVPYLSNYTYKNIFYRAVENKQEDYLTIDHYIWRWDTDWFWCSKALYMQNPLLRFLLGKWFLKSKQYSRVTRFLKRNSIAQFFLTNYLSSREFIIQDVAIPIAHAGDYFHFFDQHIAIQPIWVCPVYAYHDHPFDFFKMKDNQLYVNFGFWSSVSASSERGFYNRLIEKKVTEYGGNKSLYSDSYYTASEFWNIYDEDYYQQLKAKYDPEGRLSTLYHKCVEKA